MRQCIVLKENENKMVIAKEEKKIFLFKFENNPDQFKRILEDNISLNNFP